MLTDTLSWLLEEYRVNFIELTISCDDGFMRMGRIKSFDDTWITLLYTCKEEQKQARVIEQTFLLASILVIRTDDSVNLEALV
jgi:sRNA-binding regulator protein Hfq